MMSNDLFYETPFKLHPKGIDVPKDLREFMDDQKIEFKKKKMTLKEFYKVKFDYLNGSNLAKKVEPFMDQKCDIQWGQSE